MIKRTLIVASVQGTVLGKFTWIILLVIHRNVRMCALFLSQLCRFRLLSVLGILARVAGRGEHVFILFNRG